MFPSFFASAAASVSLLGLLMVAPAMAAGPLEVTSQVLVEASANLHRRVGLLDDALEREQLPSPVHRLQDRLSLAF